MYKLNNQHQRINVIGPQIPYYTTGTYNVLPLYQPISETPKLNISNQQFINQLPQKNIPIVKTVLVPIPFPQQNEAKAQATLQESSKSSIVYRTDNTGYINIKPVEEPKPQILNQPQPQKIYFPQNQISFKQNQEKPKDILRIIKRLGEGSFGEVYLSKFDNSNEIFATKKIDINKEYGKFIRYYEFEMKILEILKKFNHPNIIKLNRVIQENNYYYIVMEYVNGGSLTECLKKYKQKYQSGFPEEIVRHLMKQIVSAIVLLHDLNIIHRDLKLDNIMVSFDNDIDKKNLNMMKATIKIIDFGCAIILPSRYSKTKTFIGSEPYMDPNIIEKYYNQAIADKNRGYGVEVDIWSLGCVCYELYVGKYPFPAETRGELINKINIGKYPLPNYTSKELISFLDKMLKYDPKYRLSARELLNEPFLTKNVKNFIINEESNSFQETEPVVIKNQFGNQEFDENINGSENNAGLTSIYGEQM